MKKIELGKFQSVQTNFLWQNYEKIQKCQNL
jgi:hypothetical protein